MIFQRRGYGHYQDMRSAQRPLTVEGESWWSAIGAVTMAVGIAFALWVVL